MFSFIEIKMNTPTAAEKSLPLNFHQKPCLFQRHKVKFSDGYPIERHAFILCDI